MKKICKKNKLCEIQKFTFQNFILINLYLKYNYNSNL